MMTVCYKDKNKTGGYTTLLIDIWIKYMLYHIVLQFRY